MKEVFRDREVTILVKMRKGIIEKGKRRRKTSSTLPHISKSMPSDESKYEEAKEGADEVDIVKEGEWGESGSLILQGRTKVGRGVQPGEMGEVMRFIC